MNIKIITKYLGNILRLEGLFMIPALCISLYKSETSSVIAFAITIAVLILLGSILAVIKTEDTSIYAKEGFVIVAISWILMSLFGAFPFFISGSIPNFIDCWFETVSGFTTTGASILTNVEILPMGILYWRSFTHWLGGMGILVFVLAVMPLTKGSGNSLRVMRAESPGPSVGKLVPKIRHTARILYSIYIAITLIETLLLFVGGMPMFDSLLTSFGTAGTGGFGIKNASIGAYDSVYLQGVVAVFMLLFGVNFNMYYLLLLKDVKSIFRNQEFRIYFGIVATATIAITLNTLSSFSTPFEAFRHSFFQVSSIITTTGYATADFNLWPEFSRCILVLLMFIGACAGSTGGGIKIERILILVKSLRISIKKMIHPRSVKLVKVNDKVVDANTLNEIYVYMVAYTIITAFSILIVALDNFSFDTTVTAVISCVNNIGPGLGIIGPTGNYSTLSILSKLVLSADMLIGRLELFPMLLLFSPAMWKRSK